MILLKVERIYPSRVREKATHSLDCTTRTNDTKTTRNSRRINKEKMKREDRKRATTQPRLSSHSTPSSYFPNDSSFWFGTRREKNGQNMSEDWQQIVVMQVGERREGKRVISWDANTNDDDSMIIVGIMVMITLNEFMNKCRCCRGNK